MNELGVEGGAGKVGPIGSKPRKVELIYVGSS